ncbi:hypothetical protein BJ322DRAFT_1178627 [Thelephora terrestris]|uniref:Uncharacterized protein n=1 Tax=Thelephora terrestris TaxID=56493 RepID=A0A9P6HLN9_9AGAM|nr:hypothetical protein BJ322DRAFT_1178627 [Thelephora terrestris]
MGLRTKESLTDPDADTSIVQNDGIGNAETTAYKFRKLREPRVFLEAARDAHFPGINLGSIFKSPQLVTRSQSIGNDSKRPGATVSNPGPHPHVKFILYEAFIPVVAKGNLKRASLSIVGVLSSSLSLAAGFQMSRLSSHFRAPHTRLEEHALRVKAYGLPHAVLFVTLGVRKRSLQFSLPLAAQSKFHPPLLFMAGLQNIVQEPENCLRSGVGREDGNNSTRWKNREQKWFVTMYPHSILRLYKLRKQQSSDGQEPDPPDPSIEVRVERRSGV